jgi:hypothetical protein
VTELRAAHSGQHLTAPQSVQAMLSASAVSVVIGPAGRVLRWQLHSQALHQALGPQQAAPPSAAAGALCTQSVQQQQQLLQLQQQQQQQVGHLEDRFTLHWRVPMGRCVDAAPLLLALLRPAATPSRHTADNAVTTRAAGAQQQSGMGPSAAAAAAAAGNGAEELVGVLAFACSHSGQVKCVDVVTGGFGGFVPLCNFVRFGCCDDCKPCIPLHWPVGATDCLEGLVLGTLLLQ